MELLEFGADGAECLVPFALAVLVRRVIVAHGVRQSALLFEIVIAPTEQFAAGVPREKFRRGAQRSQFPRAGLGAVLAEFELRGFGRLRPCTGHAGEATRLVLPPEFPDRRRNRNPFALQDFDHRFDRTPAAGGVLVRSYPGFALVSHDALHAKEMHDSVERSGMAEGVGLAERVGFEPTVRQAVRRISSPVL